MIVPTDQDILCGKSRDCLQSPGSISFRNFIDTYTDRYVNSSTKYAKMTITKEIYEKVSQTSRFLKFNEKEKIWEEISIMAGRDKIGHALRFSARATRRKAKKTHKRSGSLSSSSSSDSAAFGWETLAGQVQPVVSSYQDNTEVTVPPKLSAQLSSQLEDHMTSDELDSFLQQVAHDAKFESVDFAVDRIVNVVNNLESMDHIVKVVNNLELEPVSSSYLAYHTSATGEDDSLSSLLSQPVGEWQEDFTEGALFVPSDFQ